MLEGYLDEGQIAEVYRAYLLGAEAHDGQTRGTGEPYIYHPIEAARILAEMHLDHRSIVAAVLHDVIEDTGVTKEDLRVQFGDEVAELVDGVSKLSHLKARTRVEAQAENLRKMFMAMAQDLRVILVKLADRLHNMRTLGGLPAQKRRRIARETLDIYAPIAHRLGINTVRMELEDLGFEAMYPIRARVLRAAIAKARGNRREMIRKIETALKRRLRQERLEGEVLGREKHLYSIYQKMLAKHRSLSDVLDVYAFRVIVDTVDMCYRVLGAVHNLYKPVPGRFKDYIAIPKANGYQSLHTVLFGPYGVPIEVQIRTRDMHKVAEVGIAAHWLYKSGEQNEGSAGARARQWLQGLLEMQKNAGDSVEFLENVKIDLFPDEVYVFTPDGDILELPRGATAVDFGYAVHTDVGNGCVAAKIDRRLAPLRTPLVSGQTVEIITAPGAGPNPAWLNFVVTGKARSNIRHYLKTRQRSESVALGRRLLDKALGGLQRRLEEIRPQVVEALVAELKIATVDDLLEQIGLGSRMAPLVARRLAAEDATGEPSRGAVVHSAGPLSIKGTEGMVLSFARCCRPIPGDPIVGSVSADRGLVIHTATCGNATAAKLRPDKWLDVEWDPGVEGEFVAETDVTVANLRGVLATVAAAIAEMGANIENVSMQERDGMTSTLSFLISVKSRSHLARIMRRLRSITAVMRIARSRG